MVAISSTVGMQAATQAGYQQFELLNAKRAAEKAEQVARALEERAGDAQRVADRANARAQTLAVQSKQARNIVGQAYQGLAVMKSVSGMQAGLLNLADQVIARQQVAAAVNAVQPPVVNTSGQVTGTVVNTTA